MSLYKEACYVATHVNQAPMHMQQKLKSEEFKNICLKIDDDNQQKTELMIKLLKSIAIEPKEKTLTQMLDSLNGEGSEVSVYIRFHRTANNIGWVTVAKDSDQYQMLKEAINENLNSKMFKAAQSSRRIDLIITKVLANVSKKGSAYRRGLMDQGKSEYKMSKEQIESINSRVSEFESQKREHYFKRFRTVDRLAYPGMEKGYTQWMAEFLFNNVSLSTYSPRETLVLSS